MERRQVNQMHALSFDVEEHFQVSAFSSQMRRCQWDQLESRVERNTSRLLDLLSMSGVKATFFVLGWVAERHPALVRSLADSGHELASHGYGHELVAGQSPAEFREDVRKAKDILEQVSGKPIFGYRAPSFSINERTQWALQILVEEGYVYDSSFNHRFRKVGASSKALEPCYQVETSAGHLWEVPLSTMITLGVHVPVAGGGYFRLMPYGMLRLFLKRLEKSGVQLVMFLHPWEIDPEQPRMEGSWLSRTRHYMNLDKTELRLKRLLQDFQFSSIMGAMNPLRDACTSRLPTERQKGWIGVSIHGGKPQEMGRASL